MAPRPVKPWVGKRPESMPGKLVLLRLYARQNGLCACGCGMVMNFDRDVIDCDHIVPLIDDGENVESNLQLMFQKHHRTKTSGENKARGKARQHQAKAFAIVRDRKPKLQSRGFDKPPPQRKASTPPKGKFPGDIMARRPA